MIDVPEATLGVTRARLGALNGSSMRHDTQMRRFHLGNIIFNLLNPHDLYMEQVDKSAGRRKMVNSMVFVEMKKHFQLRALEWWSASVMGSWGLWTLLWPGMFLENSASVPLLRFAPQHIWGLAALGAGCLRLTALMVNGLWHRTPAIRWLCSMFSVFIWFVITAAFTTGDIVNLGTVIYGWLMLADMYSAFRSASDFIEAEAQLKLQRLTIAGSGDTNVSRLTAR